MFDGRRSLVAAVDGDRRLNGDRLASLATWGVSFDCETHRIQPGLIAPPPVCGSLAQCANGQIAGALIGKDAALDALIALLSDERLILVGQNSAFDFLVMAVYAARSRRRSSTRTSATASSTSGSPSSSTRPRGHLRPDPRTGADLRDPLTNKHEVGYRLSVLVDLVLNRTDAKVNDVWRASYALLEPYPIESWPHEGDGNGVMLRGYTGLRFCLLMGCAERCGEPKVTEWNRRTISPTCRACISAAQSLREGWLKQWPENGPYFEHVSALEEAGDPVVQHVTKRLRRPGPREGAGNAIANGYFQAFLADAAKDALCKVSTECYASRRVAAVPELCSPVAPDRRPSYPALVNLSRCYGRLRHA